MATIEGVGKEAEVEVTEQGGKHSKLPYRFDLMDGPALFKMSQVLSEGATKYGEDNWRQIPVKAHVNHLLVHAYAYLSGDMQDEHLSHMLCRAMFALAIDIQEVDKP